LPFGRERLSAVLLLAGVAVRRLLAVETEDAPLIFEEGSSPAFEILNLSRR
jgi:hypothetical protein